METSEKFCLRWNEFESNISTAFRELRDDKDFFDVTLACEEEQVQAHKVILSACSQFFKTILLRNKHEHPLIYLRGVKFTDLSAVLNFMYHGEVNVAQEELNNFLAVAEDLQIKGLTQNRTAAPGKKHKLDTGSSFTHQKEENVGFRPGTTGAPPPPPPKKAKVDTVASPDVEDDDDDDIQEVHPVVKAEPSESSSSQAGGQQVDMVVGQNSYQANSSHSRSLVDTAEVYQEDEFGEFENYADEGFDPSMMEQMQPDGTKDTILDSLIENITVRKRHPVHGVVHECTVCHKVLKKKNKMKSHAEIHLKGFSHQCNYCGKYYKTRPSLKVHISTSHKLEKEQQQGPSTIQLDMETILGLH